MRIRAHHIVLAVLIAVTGFVFYAAVLHRHIESPESAAASSPPMDMPMSQAPEIVLETTDVQLGVIPNDRETVAAVTVKNTGGSRLEVRDVRSSCPRCTIGYFDPGKHLIEAGAESTLHIKVAPDGVFGFHSVKTLALSTNDPRNPQVTITVEATIDPEYEVAPEAFQFGEVNKGEMASCSVIFRSLEETPATLTGVSLNPEQVEAQPTDAIIFVVEPVDESEWAKPGKTEHRITATLGADMRGGAFEISVFLHTDVARAPLHRVVAQGVIVAPYIIELERDAPEMYLQEKGSGIITVYSDDPLELIEARAEKDMLTMQIRQEAPGRWLVQCAPKPGRERGVHRDAVLLQIGHGGAQYTERIPVTIYAHGAKTPEP